MTISWCHGQEHQAQAHLHLLFVGGTLGSLRKPLDLDVNTVLSNGKRIHPLKLSSDHTSWVITPQFQHYSVLRRLMRSVDLLILFITPSSVSEIEHWLQQFDLGDVIKINVIDDLDTLENMKHWDGTLTSSLALREVIHHTINQLTN